MIAMVPPVPGSKALAVIRVIDFPGSGGLHDCFTQGVGNNMQINTNVDEANVVGDASRSQRMPVLASAVDRFSIRRDPQAALELGSRMEHQKSASTRGCRTPRLAFRYAMQDIHRSRRGRQHRGVTVDDA